MSEDNSHLFNSPFWSQYNYVYSKTYNKYYFACKKECETCQLWSIPNNVWKKLFFMMVHCHICEHADYPDGFYFFNSLIVLCYKCYKKTTQRINSINTNKIKY